MPCRLPVPEAATDAIEQVDSTVPPPSHRFPRRSPSRASATRCTRRSPRRRVRRSGGRFGRGIASGGRRRGVATPAGGARSAAGQPHLGKRVGRAHEQWTRRSRSPPRRRSPSSLQRAGRSHSSPGCIRRHSPGGAPCRGRPAVELAPAGGAPAAAASGSAAGSFFFGGGFALLVASLLLAGPHLRRRLSLPPAVAGRPPSASCSSGLASPARPANFTRHDKGDRHETQCHGAVGRDDGPGADSGACGSSVGGRPDGHRLDRRRPGGPTR